MTCLFASRHSSECCFQRRSEVRLDPAAVAPVLSLLAGVLMAVAHVSQKHFSSVFTEKTNASLPEICRNDPRRHKTTERFTDPN